MKHSSPQLPLRNSPRLPLIETETFLHFLETIRTVMPPRLCSSSSSAEASWQ
ncbi:hypothetical protein RISK_002144 [Rhodopirellula islandica]|uniref:Uncharacterized protein n=1 Tax=Rhodopirellula islandica TaxID=595434 RepID=A0A0J1BG30_RHOIS|nr:hypothetical protein RISK_002144 [Rhodopirellula islandica]